MSSGNIIETRSILVIVDKSHLVTIGEKLYTDKMAFVRELVNNAYDADAAEVQVDIQPLAITIRDNGSGMDEEGLRQYFTIGSTLKKRSVQRLRNVNLDYPLYRTYQNNDDIFTLHVSRIITKELALQTGITSAQAAFDLQADLLTDAFKGKGF